MELINNGDAMLKIHVACMQIAKHDKELAIKISDTMSKIIMHGLVEAKDKGLSIEDVTEMMTDSFFFGMSSAIALMLTGRLNLQMFSQEIQEEKSNDQIFRDN